MRAQTTLQEGPLLRGKPVPLFSDATHRRKKQELRAFHGRTIAHKMRVKGKETAQLGKVRYKGGHAGLKCFSVKFPCGITVDFSAVEIRNRLMPD